MGVTNNPESSDADRTEEGFVEMQGEDRQRVMSGWLVVIGMALSFFLWGLLIFFAVGDKGPPEWDFGVIQDVPGESLYSTTRFHGLSSAPAESNKVQRQHVMGREEEREREGDKEGDQ
jgi:hypothetical protein